MENKRYALSLSMPRQLALQQIADQNIRLTTLRVNFLISQAIERVHGRDIDQILLDQGYVPCSECGLIGGCEHTFHQELPHSEET